MRRRTSHDPLKAVNRPTWLVIRNVHSEVVESTQLPPGTDLATALTDARQIRIANGWTTQHIPPHCAFFFCAKDGERLLVGIEVRPPTNPIEGRE